MLFPPSNLPCVCDYGRYQIVYLSPKTQQWMAPYAQETAMVSLSGGLGSAIAAEYAITRYGRAQVGLWFADVLAEHPDLYRFLHDLLSHWGGVLYYYTDGRTPMEVWTAKKVFPNDRFAPCSYDLKIGAYRAFIQAMPTLPTVLIGFKPHEVKRQVKCATSYADAIPDAVVDYPLLWHPEEQRALEEICEQDLGIHVPLLYRLGYTYNNCAGGCCRSGIASWVRTALFFPEVYAERETWEEETRQIPGWRHDRTFCTHTVNGIKERLSLKAIREQCMPQATKWLKLSEERIEELKLLARTPSTPLPLPQREIPFEEWIQHHRKCGSARDLIG